VDQTSNLSIERRTLSLSYSRPKVSKYLAACMTFMFMLSYRLFTVQVVYSWETLVYR